MMPKLRYKLPNWQHAADEILLQPGGELRVIQEPLFLSFLQLVVVGQVCLLEPSKKLS